MTKTDSLPTHDEILYRRFENPKIILVNWSSIKCNIGNDAYLK